MKKYKMKINGESYEAKVLKYDGVSAVVNVNGNDYDIELDITGTPTTPKLVRAHKISPKIAPVTEIKSSVNSSGSGVTAPIPGTVFDIKVNVGDKVDADDIVLILEAMKMESEISTHIAGTVKAIKVAKGDAVTEGQMLIEIGD